LQGNFNEYFLLLNLRDCKVSKVDNNLLVSVDDEVIPETFQLRQNYPNPFNPVTNIKFSIPSVVRDLSRNSGAENSHSQVSLKVYNILGNEIATLLNETKSPGIYEVEFDSNKYSLTSGIYFYRLQVGEFVETKKLVLMK